jgi:hypothetical protein
MPVFRVAGVGGGWLMAVRCVFGITHLSCDVVAEVGLRICYLGAERYSTALVWSALETQ